MTDKDKESGMLGYTYDSETASKEIQLTEGQAKAEAMLIAFLESTKENYASITGSAGTGKTYMMQVLLQHIEGYHCLFTAPTNKAVDVLSSIIVGSLSCTLHKFLGLSVKFVDGEQISVRKDDYNPLDWQHIQVVVVDEASMLDDNLMQLIDDDIRDFGRKYVFVGDPCQLPPIEGSLKYSRSFEVASPEMSIFLHEIVRQAADNPIIKAATVVRDHINEGTEPPIGGGVNEETNQGVYLLDNVPFLKKLEEVASDPRLHEDVDYCRIVAWRNKTTRKYNRIVRQILGMDVTMPFQPGDLVVVSSAFEREGVILAGTGQEVVAGEMKPYVHPIYGFKSWEIILYSKNGNLIEDGYPLYCLDDTSIEACEAMIKGLKEDALNRDRNLWPSFYALKSFYIDVRPPYAITAHKAQGSTFENVFVDMPDIYANRRKATADKCYYVALTRASHAAYVKV